MVLMVGTVDAWMMPLYLLAGAGVIYFFSGIKPQFDKKITKLEAGQIGLWSLFGLAGLALIGVVSQGLFVGTIPASFLALAGTSIMFSAAMAVSETIFFQGAVFTFLRRNMFPVAAILGIVGLGVLFHLQVYGTSPSNLAYAGLGYGLLSWLAYKTGRLSIAVIVHVANNVMATLFGPLLVLLLAAMSFVVYSSQKKISWRRML